MVIVSACLAGMKTRYDGKDNMNELVKALIKEGRAIPICPEQLAGLTTPRPPIEFKGGTGSSVLAGAAKAVGGDGIDYSAALVKGAEEVVRIAALYGADAAVLKDGSPSCGVKYVYSDGNKVEGMGVATVLLEKNGIEIMTVDGLKTHGNRGIEK